MTKPEDSPYVCFVDLELTGNRSYDQILEIGAVMTDRDLNELSFRNLVVRYEPTILSDYAQFEMERKSITNLIDPFVLDMHTKNGLMDDAYESRLTIQEADVEMEAWIKTFTGGDHIPLAGSGVSHFDHKYIKDQLPKFNKYLSYWSYDVGTIRRTLKLFGIDASMADTSDDKDHRALTDIRAHVEEMRRYKTIFTSWENLGLIDGARKAVWPG